MGRLRSLTKLRAERQWRIQLTSYSRDVHIFKGNFPPSLFNKTAGLSVSNVVPSLILITDALPTVMYQAKSDVIHCQDSVIKVGTQ